MTYYYVAVKNPWGRIVSHEADGSSPGSRRDHITARGVHVIGNAVCANNVKGVAAANYINFSHADY
jgi:hypothetical protein